MIKLVLDRSGRLVAVEGTGPRGVVRPEHVSVQRFAQEVREEFPELTVEVTI
jgi:hypothetical protein